MRYVIVFLALLATSSVQSQSWHPITGFPGPARSGAWMFALHDTIYTGGGLGAQVLFLQDWYSYSIPGSNWVSEAIAPGVRGAIARVYGVSCATKDHGYVGLGQDTSSALLKDWYQFDQATQTWSRMSDFPGDGRAEAFVFAIGDSIFVGGGSGAGGTLADFFRYDAKTDRWDSLGETPIAVAGAAAFSIGGYGYVICGANGNMDSTVFYGTVWRFSPKDGTWKKMSDFFGAPRAGAVGFAVGSTGYVGLGNDADQTDEDFYSYNASKDTWSSVASIPGNPARSFASAASTSTAGFVAFGSDPKSHITIGDVWTLNNAPAAVVPTMSKSSAAVYPNPCASFVQISGGGSITLTNALGLQLVKRDVSSGERMDVSALPAGMYNVEIVADGRRSWQRFVKE